MGLNTKSDYQRAIETVAAVIREWDPHGLFAMGCPADEFDREIASVVAQIPRIRGPDDAAHALSRVFGSAFDCDAFSPQLCFDAGRRLYTALQTNRLLETE